MLDEETRRLGVCQEEAKKTKMVEFEEVSEDQSISDEEEGDDSTEPESDDIISLGDDEAEYESCTLLL